MIDSGKRTICVIMLVATLLFSASPVISAKNYLKNSERFVIYVPDDFPTIQDAINHTVDGDTIIVRDGTYYEHIVVDKSISLKSENGSANCIINGGGTGTVVNITANNVTLQGFTITNGGNSGLTLNDFAVTVESSGNIIRYNRIVSNNGVGLYVGPCINLSALPPPDIRTSNNIIIYNNISNNGGGIIIINTDYSYIANNTVSSSFYSSYDVGGGGILIYNSSGNEIRMNHISFNDDCGILLYMCRNNKIILNDISFNNKSGIGLQESSTNVISFNNIESNNLFNSVQDGGIFLQSSNSNLIYLNNFINNKNTQVYLYNTTHNRWYSPSEFNYTYNGNSYTNYLGNYWSDYNGSDANGDGIGDTPYIIDANNTDNYPLIMHMENYDSIPPNVTITFPLGNSLLNDSTVTVCWKGSDFWSGIDQFQIKIDSGSWKYVGLNTTYTFTGLSDGLHTVIVSAVDKNFNTAIDAVSFTVDTTPPSLVITYPLNNSSVGTSNVTVKWSGSDTTSGIYHYAIGIDNTSWINVGTNTSYTFTSLSDGYHNVRVKAVDNAGNTAIDSITFTVDTTAPQISIIFPTENTVLNTTSVTVVWNGSDNLSGIEHYEIKIDNTTWINVGLNTTYTFIGLSDGPHTVYVKAYDKVGNTETTSVTFIVDTTLPNLSITSPYNGEAVNTSEITVRWIGNDGGSGIDHYEISIDNGSWINVGTNTSYNFTGLAEGHHTIYVKVVDNAGNENTSSITFIVDTTTPTLTITEPYDGEILNTSTVIVNWISSDNISGIDHYEIKIDNESWINVGLNTSYTFHTSDGMHTVYVKTIDRAGNLKISSVSFTTDTTSPNITVTSPSNGEILNSSTVDITWNGSDNLSGIEHYEISIDYGPWINVGLNTSYITQISDGQHIVVVKAVDKVGNSATTSITFIVDTVSPDITIITPVNNSIYQTANITVKWFGNDKISGVDHYEIKLDNGSWINVRLNTSYTFTGLFNGWHTVYLKAYDKAGNENITYVRFKIIGLPTIEVNISGDMGINGWYVSNVTVTISGENISWVLNNGSFHHETTFTLSDGIYYLKVFAENDVGNVSKEFLIKVDKKPPIMEINSSYVLKNNNTLTFKVTDENLYSIKIYLLENGTWILYAENTTTIKLNHTGNYTFKILAEDLAGNKNEKITTVSYQIESKPQPKPKPPEVGNISDLILSLLIFFAIIAGISILALLLLKRRKGSEKTPEERELTTKEKAILDAIEKYLKEQPGTTREDVIKTVASRTGATEEEVAVILDYALENYLLIQEVDEEGMKRIYLLDEEKGAEENA